jgi:uncharacterized protein
MRLPSRRNRALVIAFAAIGILFAGCAGVLVYFRVNEDKIVFHPEKGALAPPAAELGLDSRDVQFPSTDGVALVARLIPPPEAVSAETAGWVLYFHGAGANVGIVGYNEAWAHFRKLGFGVLAVDYRGFGESAGEPTEAGLYRDADAAFAYLTRTLDIATSRILIYGYSLGSAVAIDLATRVTVAGLLVEGSFLSVPRRGAEIYPYLPVNLLMRNRFASEDKIARVGIPKLFLHGRDDQDIPVAHGEALYALALPPKQLAVMAGGHVDAYKVDPTFFRTVAQFARDCGIVVLALE